MHSKIPGVEFAIVAASCSAVYITDNNWWWVLLVLLIFRSMSKGGIP
jgi:hypothetical protein